MHSFYDPYKLFYNLSVAAARLFKLASLINADTAIYNLTSCCSWTVVFTS